MFLLRSSHIRQIVRKTKTYSEVSFICRQYSTGKNDHHQQDDHPKQDYKKQDEQQSNTREEPTKAIAFRGSFETVDNKNRQTYLDVIHIFENKSIHRRGHVEFIYAALKNMESFGVHQDLEVYKALIDVLPKGKFIPTNIFQAEFMHYPKQQQCAIDLLEQMEDWGVIPDYDMEDILINVFGRRGHPVRKFWRMMYWMPKFKNLSPWLVPNPPPNDVQDLAKLAVERMCSVDIKSVIKVYETKDVVEDAIDDTWIVSGQSPDQTELLQKYPVDTPVYIEGPSMIWLRNKCVHYFTMRSKPMGNDTSQTKDGDDDDPDGRPQNLTYIYLMVF